MVVFDHNLDPLGAGWQQTRSLLALGGGKLTGQGLFHGIQTQGEYSGSRRSGTRTSSSPPSARNWGCWGAWRCCCCWRPSSCGA